MTLAADDPVRTAGYCFEVPLPVLADLTAQALLLVDPQGETVLYVSTRSLDLLNLKDSPPALPAKLSQFLEPDDGLTDWLHLALSMSAPLIFGARARGGRERIVAKAQRLDLWERSALLLISLEQEPELARRFRSLSERMVALDEEVGRRRKAERSLSATSAALSRSLAVVRGLSGIVTSEGEHIALATDTVTRALSAAGAVMITRSGTHFSCSARTGTQLPGVDLGTPLEVNAGLLSSVWTERPAQRNAMLIGALEAAAGETLSSARLCVIPISVIGKPEGALITVHDKDLSMSEITDFEIGIIGEALSSLLARAEMESRLTHSQKLEAIGRLTGGIAHDFNNILAVILGNAELLLDDADGELAELADEIQSSALRGAYLTSQLLSFGRKQPLRPQSTDVNALARTILPMIRRSIGEDIDLRLVASDRLWSAVIDRQQLEMALLNLSINARDAMPDGGKLTVETANATLDEEYAAAHDDVEPGPYVMIAISDTGTGMDAMTAEQAFAPFFTTKDVGKGSGLGLSMVYGFTKQSGGHVKIYSELGHGTTVRIYLPRDIDNDQIIEDEQVSGQNTREKGNGRILLVEDDLAVLRYTERMLRALGYKVDPAQSGAEAIDLLDRGPYELVLTDVVLPGSISGSGVAAHAKLIAPDRPVLFMSGYPASAVFHHGRLDSDAQLISKPFTRRQLAERLKELIGS